MTHINRLRKFKKIHFFEYDDPSSEGKKTHIKDCITRIISFENTEEYVRVTFERIPGLWNKSLLVQGTMVRWRDDSHILGELI